ncbi:MAG: hypothetical protein U5K72_14675 [Balneolaceae bacterium]|nr:hypothetical protein [Balneolaceae bacterium]
MDHSNHKHSQHKDHEHHDHREHHKQMVEDFKFRFWWVLALTIPIMALSPMIQTFMGVDWRFTGDSVDSCRSVYGGLFLWRMAISHRIV